MKGMASKVVVVDMQVSNKCSKMEKNETVGEIDRMVIERVNNS